MLSNRNIKERFIKFPNVVSCLWDGTPVGNGSALTLSNIKNIQIYFGGKVIQQLQKFDYNKYYLLGNVSIDDKGIENLTIDVTDFSADLKNNEAASYNYICKLTQLITNKGDHGQLSSLKTKLKLKCKSFTNKKYLDGHLFSGEGIYSQINAEGDSSKLILNLACIIHDLSFAMFPISPVPFIETALARYLMLNLTCQSYQTEVKTGYMSMDKTRRIIFVLKNDPNVIRIPIIGIWISGIFDALSVKVWLACAEYHQNSNLKRKLYCSKKSFLVVVFCSGQNKPLFYECKIPEREELGLYLLYQNEVTDYKPVSSTSKLILNFEESFTCKTEDPVTSKDINSNKRNIPKNSLYMFDSIEIQPQPVPNPHPKSKQEDTSKPNVPDISLNLDSFSQISPVQHGNCQKAREGTVFVDALHDISICNKEDEKINKLEIIGNKLESFLQKVQLKPENSALCRSQQKLTRDQSIEEISEIELPRNDNHSLDIQETSCSRINLFEKSQLNDEQKTITGICSNVQKFNAESLSTINFHSCSLANISEDPVSLAPSIHLCSEDFTNFSSVAVIPERKSFLLHTMKIENHFDVLANVSLTADHLTSTRLESQHSRISTSRNIDELLNYKIPIWDLSLVSMCHNDCSFCQDLPENRLNWSLCATSSSNLSHLINKMAVKYLNRSKIVAASSNMQYDACST